MGKLLRYINNVGEFRDSNNQSQFLTPQDAIYFCDSFDLILFNKLLKQHGKPACVVVDVESPVHDCSVPVIFIPALTMGMSNYTGFFPESTDIKTTDFCFNFSINKKTPDRYCLLKLIEWFNLDSYVHTWSGVGASFDCTQLISEFEKISDHWNNQEFRTCLLAPVQKIKTNWLFPNDIANLTSFNRDQGNQTVFMANATELFAASAVALIAESSTLSQPNFCFTEKTLLALASLNFPIWVGSYGQARQARIMGFDIFPDLINHDYQFKSTVLERCYHAVHDNLQLLTDLQLAARVRQECLDRLIANRAYMMGTGFCGWVRDQIQKLPKHIQQQIFDLMIPINK